MKNTITVFFVAIMLISASMAFAEKIKIESIPQLKIQIANLVLENSGLRAKLAGAEAQITNLQQQIQLQQRMDLMQQFCPPIPLENCQLSADGVPSDTKANAKVPAK